MSEANKNNGIERMNPGVCFPWEEKKKEITFTGKEEILKNEWEKLDMMAYLYLWYWVHR